MDSIEGANLGECAYVESVDGEGKGSLGDDSVDGKFLLEDVGLDGECGYCVREEVLDPNGGSSNFVYLFYSAFCESYALVVDVVLVEDAGDLCFVP